MYISKKNEHWDMLIEELQYSQKKSNKDVMCTRCWRILNYQEGRAHKSTDHRSHIITSKNFSNEKLFISLAKKHQKLRINDEGKISVRSPFYSEIPELKKKESVVFYENSRVLESISKSNNDFEIKQARQLQIEEQKTRIDQIQSQKTFLKFKLLSIRKSIENNAAYINGFQNNN